MSTRTAIDRFRRAEEGATAVIVGISLTMLMGMLALGVDLAVLTTTKSALQKKTDLAAMGAASDLDRAAELGAYVLTRNTNPEATLEDLQYGRFLADPALAPGARLTLQGDERAGANAVQVSLSTEAPLTFSRAFLPDTFTTLRATGTASRDGAVSFSLGSRLARLDAGILNSLLSAAFGTTVNLTLVDYNALAGADVQLLPMIEQLGLELGLEAANYLDVLDLSVAAPTLLTAIGQQLSGTNASIVLALAALSADVMIPMSDIVTVANPELGLRIEDFLEPTSVNLLALLKVMADIVNAERTLPLDVALNVPGLLSLDTALRLSERAAHSGWVMVSEPRATLHTAQTRLKLEADVNPNLLGFLGVGIQALALNLPVYAEVANATATLSEMNCHTAGPSDDAVVFDTGNNAVPNGGNHVAELYIGEFSAPEFDSSAPLDLNTLDYADFLDLALTIALPLLPDIRIGLLTIQIRSWASIGESRVEEIAFTRAEADGAPATETFGSGNLLGTAASSLLSSERLQIRVKPDHQSLVSALVAPILNPLLQTLPGLIEVTLVDLLDAILNQTLSGVGIGVGEADLTLNSLNCGYVRLVQ